MFRTLEEVANATPKDYLSHGPLDPTLLALQMILKAERLFPISSRPGDIVDQSYDFLYVGPGSGNVIQDLIDQGHRAFGLETSRRGIASAPELIRNYILWSKPWELPFPSMKGESPVPFKMFHVALLNKYLKELLTPEEWAETVKEVKKVSKYSALYASKI